jgi:hypothetical protein
MVEPGTSFGVTRGTVVVGGRVVVGGWVVTAEADADADTETLVVVATERAATSELHPAITTPTIAHHTAPRIG